MAFTFKLPDLGEGLHEADLVAWHVNVGDRVVANQPLCSIETDKAIVEVPSPQSGHIAELFAEPGQVIQVGAPLVAFDDDAAAPRPDASGSVLELPEDGATAAHPAKKRPTASPAVRRLAASLGIDLAGIQGTGPDGAITKSDLDAAAPAAAGVEKKLTGVRRAMRLNMERAGREVVASTVSDEANIDSWPNDEDTTVRLVRAIVAGCVASPSLNAWFDAGNDAIRLHSQIHLAVAIETEDGLFAPVIREVQQRSADEIREALESIKAEVAARSIPRAMLSGATFTLSNFGMFGGRFANLVVMPPQVAILGAGRAGMRVVERSGAPGLSRQLPLSLSFDHRVVTGFEALRFLNAVIEDLEKSN